VATLGEGNVQLILKGDVPVAGAKAGKAGSGERGAGSGAAGGGGPASAVMQDALPNELRQRIRQAGGKVLNSLTTLEEGLRVTRTTGGKDAVTVTERSSDFARGLRGQVLRATTSAYEAEKITPGMTRAQVLQTQAGTLTRLASDLKGVAAGATAQATAKGELVRLEAIRQTAASLERQSAEKLARAAQLSANNANQLLDYRNMRLRFDRDEAQRERKAATKEERDLKRFRERAVRNEEKNDNAALRKASAMLRQKQGQLGTDMTADAALAEIAALQAGGWTMQRQSAGRGFKRSQGMVGTEMFRLTRTEGGFKETRQFDLASVGGQRIAAVMTTARDAIKATRGDLGGLTGDFVKNTEKVAAWASSVGLIYGALGLARQGLKAYLDTSYQLQRLDAVYRKVGGSSHVLMNDLLSVAAANGRSAEEASNAAIEWSRYGLTRRQVIEATTVSLKAANVAELEAAQATKYLQAIMLSYGLNVSQLSSTLGQLNYVSNNFGVSNQDLLTGLSRTASVAKQAGVPLAELIGIIGAGVGTTGQSGANIGNAVKSVITAMGSPDLQKSLKDQFGLQFTDQAGNLREMSQVLSELYVNYQRMTKAEQQSLLFQVGGKTQSSRLAALLDSYIEAQRFAITNQLNLNSAEEENVRIVGTLRSQLQAVNTELTKFAFNQGANGPGQVFGFFAQSLQNVLRVLNTPLVGSIVTGMAGLTTAIGARAALGKLQLDRRSENPGFAARSVNGLADAYAKVTAHVGGLARNFEAASQKAGTFWQLYGRMGVGRFGRAVGGLDRLGEGLWATGTGMWAQGRGQVAYGRSTAKEGATRMLVGAGSAALGAGAMGVSAGLAGLGTVLAELLIPLGLVVGGLFAFNKVMESLGRSSAGSDERLETFNKKFNLARGSAGAAGQTVQFYETAIRTLAESRNPNSRRQVLEMLGSLPSPLGLPGGAKGKALQDELLGLRDPQAIRAKLAPYQDAARQEALGQGAMGILVQRNRVAELTAEVKRLEGKPNASQDLLLEKRAQLREAELQAMQGMAEYLDGENEALDRMVTSEQKRLVILERQRVVAESLASFYQRFASDDPFTQQAAKVNAMTTELDILGRRKQVLLEQDKAAAQATGERAAKAAALEENAAELTAQTAQALDSRARRGSGLSGGGVARYTAAEMAALKRADEMRTEAAKLKAATPEEMASSREKSLIGKREEDLKRNIETEQARRVDLEQAVYRGQQLGRDVGSRYEVGDNETEKTNNRLRGLMQEQAVQERLIQSEESAVAKLEAAGKLQAILIQQKEALLALQSRGAKLDAEALQLQRDKTRELQKSLLTAGPEDLLKKLAALDITRRNPNGYGNGRGQIGAGRFFALGSLREDVMSVPGFGFEEARLRREKNQFNATGAGGPDGINPYLKNVERMLVQLQQTAGKIMGPEMVKSFDQLTGRAGDLALRFGDLSDRAVPNLLASFDALAAKFDSLTLLPGAGGGGGSLPSPLNGARFGAQPSGSTNSVRFVGPAYQ
jgi:TP901 family phage tail tape measure protein